MTETQTAWLAGLLEGEACFTKLSKQNTVVIILRMTDRDIVEKAASLMQGKVREVPNAPYKTGYEVTVYGDKAAGIMMAILPHMGSRRTAKILAMLQVNASKLTRHQCGKLSGSKKRALRDGTATCISTKTSAA